MSARSERSPHLAHYLDAYFESIRSGAHPYPEFISVHDLDSPDPGCTGVELIDERQEPQPCTHLIHVLPDEASAEVHQAGQPPAKSRCRYIVNSLYFSSNPTQIAATSPDQLESYLEVYYNGQTTLYEHKRGGDTIGLLRRPVAWRLLCKLLFLDTLTVPASKAKARLN